MEQVRAINALEPFILLSKSASSPRRAAELVSQAISAPSTYVFAELLQTPNIQALRDSPEYSPHLRLLEIFAWGTIADYQNSPTPLPPLTQPQREKLQLLSLLSAISTAGTGSPVPYAALQPALAPTANSGSGATPAAAARALERAVTEAVLAGLLDARLDPRARAVHVGGGGGGGSGVPALRDAPPGSVPGMARGLEAWVARCDGALAEVARREADVRARARERAARQGRVKALFDARVAALPAAGASSGGGGGADAGTAAGVAGLSPGDGGDGKKRALGVEGKEAKKMAKREVPAAGDLMDVDGQGKGAKRPHFSGFNKRFN